MAKHGDVATGPGWELRCGDYREVLADVEPDAVITDPPYSERTHAGHRAMVEDAAGAWKRSDGGRDRIRPRTDLRYASWTTGQVQEFCRFWSPRTGWLVALSDSRLIGRWEAFAAECGRTTFQPVPCVISGMTVRLAGDGPSSWAVYANVSRPKALAKWGTLPGAHVGKQADREHIGGKPLWLMRALVRDYSRPGDLVCDPCAGGGTTLLAAVLEGRRAIGAELDPVTFEKAVKRLRNHAITPPLFHDEPKRMEQVGLGLDDEEAAQ